MRPEEVQEFARQEVFQTLVDRYEHREFSRDLWKKMADAGLFRFLVPEEYGTRVIAWFGSREQRARYLPSLVHGERVGALAASEPDSGAEPWP